VYINDIKVSTLRDVAPIIIPAMGYSDIAIKVAFSPLSIGQNAVDLILGSMATKDALIRLNGYAKVKTAFIKTSVPVTYATTLKEYLKS
jgi:LEA14-like dessication related protein